MVGVIAGVLFALGAFAPSVRPAHAPLASTYDEAACADEALGEPPPPPESCEGALPLPPVPAIIDCNDPGMSPFVGEMIGSCDMPRAAVPSPSLATVKGARGSTSRLCDGVHCTRDSQPIRAGGRPLDDFGAVLLDPSGMRPLLGASPYCESAQNELASVAPSRLERPPRIFA